MRAMTEIGQTRDRATSAGDLEYAWRVPVFSMTHIQNANERTPILQNCSNYVEHRNVTGRCAACHEFLHLAVLMVASVGWVILDSRACRWPHDPE